jgi:hypothetical protein
MKPLIAFDLCLKHLNEEHKFARTQYVKLGGLSNANNLLIDELGHKWSKQTELGAWCAYILDIQTVVKPSELIKSPFVVDFSASKVADGLNIDAPEMWTKLFPGYFHSPLVVSLRARERAHYEATCEDCKSKKATNILNVIL